MIKYYGLIFIILVLFSCVQKPKKDILPYGYYEDKHWNDLETYHLYGNVKRRDSYYLEVFGYSNRNIKKDSVPTKYQTIKFNENGFQIYGKERAKNSSWHLEADSTITIFKYHYQESFDQINLRIIESSTCKKMFTWDELDRITAIEYFKNKRDTIPNSIKRYEYLKETKLKIRESEHDGNNSIMSYINYNFDEELKLLSWEQYWGNPIKLAESLEIKYDRNNIPNSTIRYEKFYDSVLPITFESKLHLNKKAQEVDHVIYNKDSTSVLQKYTFKYNENDRLIFKDYRDNESKRFEINEYKYEDDLLRSEIYTRWQPARDTVITTSLFKYDEYKNCIEEHLYLNNQLYSRIDHKLEYYAN